MAKNERAGRTALRLDGPELARQGQSWADLLARDRAASPFLSRSVLGASRAGGLVPAATRFLVAVGEDGRWRALLPFRPARVGLGRRRALAAWASIYGPDSRPLLDGDDREGAADALLAAMARDGPLWLLPQWQPDSAPGRAVAQALIRRGGAATPLAAYRRPILRRRPSVGAWEAEIRPERLRDLARRERGLAKLGAVSHEVATEAADRPAALADFLSLEAAGWKGRRGTALASRPGARTYAEALFGAEGGDVGIRIDRLVLEGRTIAASLALVARGTAYLLKTAYDESLARFAPGLLLERAIIRACHETGFADALDTTAEEETGPFAELYPDRMTVVDLLLSPDGAIGLDELARIAESELQRRLLRNRAVGLYWAARDRLATLRGGAG